MLSNILKAYGIVEAESIDPLVSGLINKTWKVTYRGKQFILQRINDHVFKRPFDLAENIRMIDSYLKKIAPDYLFASPLITLSNEDIVYEKEQGYFRVFPFIKESHTIDIVSSPEQAFEAAFQFGKFTQLLSGFDVTRLHITIPDFHNLTLRYRQFEEALKRGNPDRISQSKSLIDSIKKHNSILIEFEKIQKNSDVKKRVTHHDTKISNVLFDYRGKGICIIDLDTIMPGYFISDVGDMLRTYLSPANEEEKNFDAIEIREDFFQAIVHGYGMAMGNELTRTEQGLLLYSGLFLAYMQAIRFLTDYFNNDLYYGARYEGQNFVRAGNQLDLLKKLLDKTEVFQKIVGHEFKNKVHFLK